jgi:hypothetical protein
MEKTAVEWLAKKIGKLVIPTGSELAIEKLVQQAKEMERKQIIDAQLNGQRADIPFAHEAKEEAEIYYQETFKLE